MFEGIDIVGLWDAFIDFLDKIVAWLAFVLGDKDFDSDYDSQID